MNPYNAETAFLQEPKEQEFNDDDDQEEALKGDNMNTHILGLSDLIHSLDLATNYTHTAVDRLPLNGNDTDRVNDPEKKKTAEGNLHTNGNIINGVENKKRKKQPYSCHLMLTSPSTPPPVISITNHDNYDDDNDDGDVSTTSHASSSLSLPSRKGELLHAQRRLKFDGLISDRKKQRSSLPKYRLAPNRIPNLEKVVPVECCTSMTLGAFNESKKRCAWITPQSDASYVAYHDEEWGVPIHDDKRLFELLVLAGAQAEHSWSTVLSRREIYRHAFCNFDPALVSKFNETKVATITTMLTEIMQNESKIRSVVSNAKLVMKIIDEVGSFHQYLWGFLNYKPISNSHRHPRCIPVKTSKSELISKDLQKRGFRQVSPIVVYSFMQAIGMVNDHLVSCFRYQECIASLMDKHYKYTHSNIKPKAKKSITPRVDKPIRKPPKPIFSPIYC